MTDQHCCKIAKVLPERHLNISTGTLTDSASAKQNGQWRNSYFPRCSCTIWPADLKLWLPLPALDSTWKVGFTSSLIVGFTSISCLMPCSNSSAGPTTSPLVIIRTLQQADHSNFQLYDFWDRDFYGFFREKTNTRDRSHQGKRNSGGVLGYLQDLQVWIA